jgi:hypothetical protein
VKKDGRMGAAYVALDDRIPARAFVVQGPPSSMRSELSAMDGLVADTPSHMDLTILTDSLAGIQKLESLQRNDFPEWLHGHPERALLESLVGRINERARAQVFTRIIKVPAHRAHALNEAADAAASLAAEVADIEDVALCHADGQAVRFYLTNRLTEWGAGVRKALAQAETTRHRTHLTSLLSQPAGTDDDGSHRTRRGVSLTAEWLLRPEQGRSHIGRALAGMRIGAKKRRLLPTLAGVFPCRALLHRWGKAPSPQCLLCGQGNDTVAHIQCWCPILKEARIAAHHAIAARILLMLQTQFNSQWHFHPELAVSSLRAIDVPLDLHGPWHRMVDELDEADDTDQEVDHLHPLARLRPDIWAISWSKRQVLLLELTRANDWRQDWASTTDAFKVHWYARLQTRMQSLLPQGWVVDTVPLTVGIRGSLDEPAWDRTLDRFGSSIAHGPGCAR